MAKKTPPPHHPEPLSKEEALTILSGFSRDIGLDAKTRIDSIKIVSDLCQWEGDQSNTVSDAIEAALKAYSAHNPPTTASIPGDEDAD